MDVKNQLLAFLRHDIDLVYTRTIEEPYWSHVVRIVQKLEEELESQSLSTSTIDGIFSISCAYHYDDDEYWHAEDDTRDSNDERGAMKNLENLWNHLHALMLISDEYRDYTPQMYRLPLEEETEEQRVYASCVVTNDEKTASMYWHICRSNSGRMSIFLRTQNDLPSFIPYMEWRLRKYTNLRKAYLEFVGILHAYTNPVTTIYDHTLNRYVDVPLEGKMGMSFDTTDDTFHALREKMVCLTLSEEEMKTLLMEMYECMIRINHPLSHFVLIIV